MEKLIIWLATLALVLAVLIPYFRKFHRGRKRDFLQKKEAARLGLDRPHLQYPLIDSTICIGCGACVKACPEGDVLGVVYGTATVINGARCVGHARCEVACPVGAIKVGLGDIHGRDDLPVLTEYNETTVSGMFIAGELAGFSLIRNAIIQGQMVVENIAQQAKPKRYDKMMDLVIVGAGPAGLSAALTAIQHKLSYLVLEEQDVGGSLMHYPRRKLVMTQPVEMPLHGRMKATVYSKERLLEIWREIVARFKVNILTKEKVERVIKQNGGFEIYTPKGIYRSRYVVLALGRRGTPRRLGVPGEQLSKVMYQLIDSQSYSGLNLLVVGGGDAGVEAAIGLAQQTSNKVTLCYLKESFLVIKKKNEEQITQLIREGKIQPLADSQVKAIKEKSVLVNTEKGLVEIPNDYVFIFIGGIPPYEMLKAMGIAFGGQSGAVDKPQKNLARIG